MARKNVRVVTSGSRSGVNKDQALSHKQRFADHRLPRELAESTSKCFEASVKPKVVHVFDKIQMVSYVIVPTLFVNYILLGNLKHNTTN